MLKEVIGDKIDILLISETKLNDTFPLTESVYFREIYSTIQA